MGELGINNHVMGSVHAGYWAQCMLGTGLGAFWVLDLVHAGYWAQRMLGIVLSACWVLC